VPAIEQEQVVPVARHRVRQDRGVIELRTEGPL